MKRLTLFLSSAVLVLGLSSWGFYSHKKINRLAVFTLPAKLNKFYKRNNFYITEHAVDADKRRYIDTSEAVRHYLDADHYGEKPFDSIPMKWGEAVEKFSEDTLLNYGILPWQIARTYGALVKAFQSKDSLKILKYSSDLGHYISDAHVPLHTTENYNGQLTKQKGIHAFWESRLSELFSVDYDYIVGKAKYIEDPLVYSWKILRNTYSMKDSVLLIEARLTRRFPEDRKYTFAQRQGKVEKQYSEEFSRAYHSALGGMVEKQMRASILAVGSFWYSAWIDAGQPDLSNFNHAPLLIINETDKQEESELTGRKIIGREEE